MQTQTARGEHASASLPARNPANRDSHEDVGNTSGEHPSSSRPVRVKPLACRLFADGARRDRTADLLLAKQALSQLSYGPSLWMLTGELIGRATIEP